MEKKTMSAKDMLGSVVRALVGVPKEYLGTLLDVVNRLGAKDVAKVAHFARDLKLFLRDELSVCETQGITPAEPSNPDEFFRTRPGLWVEKNFRDTVVAKANQSPAGTSLTVGHTLLARYTTDTEIEKMLPKNHFFDETQVCALIIKMIREQWGGKKGELLNGCSNFFYLHSCVVCVDWFADRPQVGRQRVGARRQRVGCRRSGVLSRN